MDTAVAMIYLAGTKMLNSFKIELILKYGSVV
jgi:hypothetical protein